ncbi:AAA family ATPase [Chromobacterium rhizoryzae]|uniref:AAA family ATPase n=1 Tax=Chromobacterium rhizoryzae TaxID=1778675 RepID=UPI001D08B2EC|nr:AAA family ATPase [Chromobacterium rhizoryzae]
MSDFEGRCAYCEREIGTSEGISHFRPLSIADEDGMDNFVDHYTWLAFEWFNLFLLCRRCQKAKADRFPVMNGRRARYLATFDEVRAEEKPYLIDPTVDNPSSHISYLISGECISKKNSPKSIATIEILDLNDKFLVFDRQKTIERTLQVWRYALENRNSLPNDFLLAGSFVGACRDVVLRILGIYGPHSLSINNGFAIRQNIDAMIGRGDREELDRIIAVMDLTENSDQVRLKELQRRTFGTYQSTSPVSPAPQPVELRSARGELSSLRVTNFRAINDVQIPFPKVRSKKAGAPCLLLLGENATGKSTCLSAMALALLGTKQAKKLRLPYHELARSVDRKSWNLWGTQGLEVTVRFHDQREYAEFYYDPIRDRLDGTPEQSAVVLGYGPHRYFANAKGRRGVSSSERVRSLFDPRRPLPDPSEWLRGLSGRQFDQVARTIRTILPTGDDDQLVKDMQAGICVLAQGQLTPVSQLSEGYRSIFAMVADICRSLLDHWSNLETAQGVVLIDEIETHLHPRWKMRVISSLRNAFPSVQFIATTHDPLCVRGMDDGEVIVLTRDSDGGVQILDDLPDISGMSAEQILTSEYFGLSSTIDSEVHLEIARLAHRIEGDPMSNIGAEAKALISKLTIGDSAAAQIIHEALVRYLRERERPVDSLSQNARADAVAAVFKALRASRGA